MPCPGKYRSLFCALVPFGPLRIDIGSKTSSRCDYFCNKYTNSHQFPFCISQCQLFQNSEKTFRSSCTCPLPQACQIKSGQSSWPAISGLRSPVGLGGARRRKQCARTNVRQATKPLCLIHPTTCLVCLLRLVCGGGHVKWCHEVAKAVRIVIFKLFVASCCDFTHEANIIDT